MTDHTDLIARLRAVESSTLNMSSSVTTNWYRNPDGLDAADALEAQAREIERLETRLEVWATNADGTKRVRTGDSADGIACRDETIRHLEKRLAEIEAQRDGFLAALATAEGKLAEAEATSLARYESLFAVNKRLAEAERDAARYRWLRHRIPVTAIHCRTESISMLPADQGEPTDEAYASEVDAAIDAAMEGGE